MAPPMIIAAPIIVLAAFSFTFFSMIIPFRKRLGGAGYSETFTMTDAGTYCSEPAASMAFTCRM